MRNRPVGLSEAATGATISRVENVHIRRSTLASPDAVRLIAALNAELTTTFPEPGATHFSLGDAQVVAGEGAFLVAYLDDVAVDCGAVRRLDEATAEVKRMYVDPSVRGPGHRARAGRGPRARGAANRRNEDGAGDGDASRTRDKAVRSNGVCAHPALRRISIVAEHEPVFR